MDTAKSLAKKINEKLAGKKYFYVSNEIEHGLGLSEYIDNFTHVCLHPNYMVDYLWEEKKDVLCISEEEVRSSSELLKFIDVEDSYIQTFKISPQFEKHIQDNSGILMNTSTRLNQLFERKISQINLFESAGINIPKFVTGKMILMDYGTLSATLGESFVVQFDRGHTGKGTHFISGQEDYLSLVQKFPQREARFSQKVEGKTYTLNACMTSSGLFAGGLSEQLTGIKGLTKEKGGTVGNDFNHDLSPEVIGNVLEELEKFEFLLARNGYKGLFGIDFIWNKEDNSIVLIEINARQTMSVVFHSSLQRLQNEVPLNLLHVAEFLGLQIDIDSHKYSRAALSPINAIQVFKRNSLNEKYVVKSTHKTTGEYLTSQANMDFVKSAYSIEDVAPDNILFLNQKLGATIKYGGEISRIQARKKDLSSIIELLINN